MSKVIVERPRRQWPRSKPGRRPPCLEALPFRVGIKKTDWGESLETKDLNENLAPLRRFLERQVGRRWDKVFSEINAQIKPSNTVQAHVLSHIDDFIERRVSRVPATRAFPCGLVSANVALGRRRAVRPGELYVDPTDGIIKLAKRRYFDRQSPAETTHRRINAGEVAVKLEGIWYAVDVKPFRVERRDSPYRDPRDSELLVNRRVELFTHITPPADRIEDVVLGNVLASDSRRLRERYGADVYGVAKRQLSSRELRNLALVND